MGTIVERETLYQGLLRHLNLVSQNVTVRTLFNVTSIFRPTIVIVIVDNPFN